MGRNVFITGGTGYIGRRLIDRLTARGHSVRALVRPGSEGKLPPGCTAVVGDALDSTTFAREVRPGDTFVQLVGTPHPGPAKAAQFQAIDLVSVRESAAAASAARVAHFIYVSVAHPAPAMHAYIDVRRRGEAMIRERGLNATILRPWYVIGPGHWWPLLLVPFYRLCELIPSTRATALRLGLVRLEEMLGALVFAVEHPASGIRIVEVPAIRAEGREIRSKVQGPRSEGLGAESHWRRT